MSRLVHNLTDLTVEALGPANRMTHADLPPDAATQHPQTVVVACQTSRLRLIIPTTPKR